MRVHIVLFEHKDGEEVINVFQNEMDAEDYAEQRSNRTKRTEGRYIVETYEVIE